MEQSSLRKKIRGFFAIPEEIRADFWQETLRKNSLSLWVVCIIIFVTETYNVLRVLLWSRSGLGTLNNRIYFGMYCALLAAAALYLLLQRLLRGAKFQVRWGVQYAATLVFFLWHILLNTYDLMGSPDGGTAVFTTAILGLAIFIQMPSLFSILCFLSGYLLFYVLAGPFLSAGEVLNLSITFFVAAAVSLTNSHHAAVSLCQRREIIQINARLKELAQKDSLTGLLNKAALESGVRRRMAEGTGDVTLFLLDLDDFKRINDSFGHPCGDYILMEMAVNMRAIFPADAVIGRIGGDEFAVFLDRAVEERAALAMGARLIQGMAQLQWDGQAVGASCSIGACTCRRTGLPYERLYQETDRVLYSIKRSGKGRCGFGMR